MNSHQGSHGCCASPRAEPALSGMRMPARGYAGSGGNGRDSVQLPAASFAMGDCFDEGYPADGETPVHTVNLSAFNIDTTQVTNSQFARFIADTGYRTEAEHYGTSAVFHLEVRAPPGDVVGVAAGTPWWTNVRGADWAHPYGARSHWSDLDEHPVVHVSWNDARAYCSWAGRRLPSEAEWEFAARGGLEGKRYAWGDDLTAGGKHQCNIWQGVFPHANTGDDGFVGTAPVGSFAPNGYGLYDVAGNVWEWCEDWFLPRYYRTAPADAPTGPRAGVGRVMRGGSYLCHSSYCNRYRVAARSSNTPSSSSGNIGFRTAASASSTG